MEVPGEQDDPNVGPARKLFLQNAQAPLETRLRLNAEQAQPIEQTRAARVLNQKVKTAGMDATLIDLHLDEVERDTAIKEFNAQSYRNSDKIAKWFSESPYHIAVTKDPQARKALGDLDRIFRRKDDLTRPLTDDERARSIRTLAKARQEFAAKGYESDIYGNPRPAAEVAALVNAELPDLTADVEREVDKREKFILSQDKVGLIESFTGPQAPEALEWTPFSGQVVSWAKEGRLTEAALAVQSGKATDDQIDLLVTTGRIAAALERRGEDLWGKVANTVAGSLKFGAEIAGGPMGLLRGAVTKALAGGGAKALLKGAAASVMSAGLQTATVGVPQIAVGVLQRMSPETQLDHDTKTGELGVRVTAEGKSWQAALPAAAADAFIEVWSEMAGGAPALAASKLFPKSSAAKFLFGAWSKGPNSGKTYSAFVKAAQKAGIHGTISEIGEEEWGKFLKAVVSDGDPYRLPTPEELLTQAIAFSLPGAAMGGAALLDKKRKTKAAFDAVTQGGANMDLLEAAGVPLEIRQDLADRFTRGTDAETTYLEPENAQEFFQSLKDEKGFEYSAEEVVKVLTGSSSELKDAADEGRYVRIPTAEYLTSPLLKNVRKELDKKIRLSPTEMSVEQQDEFQKQLDEGKEFLGEIDKDIQKELLAREEGIESEAKKLDVSGLEEEARVAREGDIITKIGQDFSGLRIGMKGKSKKVAEEMVTRGFPKNLMGDISKKGKGGKVVAADEVAAKYGMTDEEMIDAVVSANAHRRDYEGRAEKLKDAPASERSREAVVGRVRTEVVREKSGQVDADIEAQSAAVEEHFRTLLVNAGIAPDTAQSKAELFAAFFRTMSQRKRTGKSTADPMALLGKYGLTITNKDLADVAAGTVYLQESPEERIVQGFYHKIQKTIEEKMPARAPVEQVRGLIKDMKAEEREWSGVDEWLDGVAARGVPVEKGSLLEQLKANQLALVEVVRELGDTSTQERLLLEAKDAERAAEREANVEYGKLIGTIKRDDLFEEYHKLPDPGDPKFDGWLKEHGYTDLWHTYQIASMKVDRASTLVQNRDRQLAAAKMRRKAPQYRDYTLASGEGAKDYKELLFVLPQKFVKEDFTHNHWREKNVLGHVRFSTRVGEKGEDVLVIEEVQSDWHQRGRDLGYRGRDSGLVDGLDYDGWDNRYNALMKSRSALYNQLEADLDKAIDQKVAAGGMHENQRLIIQSWTLQARELAKEHFPGIVEKFFAEKEPLDVSIEAAIEKRNEAYSKATEGAPNAPLKKTWHEFIMKRMIRYAAENGFKKLAWTTGAQQNERYSLSKHVDEITLRASASYDKMYSLYGYKDGARVFDKHDVPEAEVRDYVGKELAEKLLAQPTGEGREGRVRVDKTVEIGGSGMKGFYDQILPSFMEKFVKKYGSKVGYAKVKNPIQSAWSVVPVEQRGNTGIMQVIYRVEDANEISDYTTIFEKEEDANDWANKMAVAEAEKRPNDFTIHSIDMTPLLRQAALIEGFSFFQNAKDKAGKETSLGRIVISDERKFAVELFPKQNLSTMLHEGGHAFLEIMADLAEADDASEDLKADYAEILKWMGVKKRSEIKRQHHEAWADAFVDYLKEGRAPSPRLRAAFNKFIAWLEYLYQKYVMGSEIALTPEIRGVMDRMLATREEIATAYAEAAYQTVEGLVPMTEAEGKEYREKIFRDNEEANGQLVRKMIREQIRARDGWYKDELDKLVQEASAELDASNPAYAMRTVLRNNTYPDGTPRAQSPIKLQSQEVRERWPELAHKLAFMHSLEGGLPADDVAREHGGWDSGDAMIRALAGAPPLGQEALRVARQRMTEQFGEPMTDQQIAEAAQEALHNEMRGELLMLEYTKFAQLSGNKTSPHRVIKAWAMRQVGRETVRKLKPHEHQAAARKANREAFKAAATKDYNMAFKWKQAEIKASELYRLTSEKKEQAARIAEYMESFDREGTQKRIIKAGADYWASIQEIRERFEFGRKSQKAVSRTMSFRDFITKLREEGYTVEMSEAVLAETFRIHYSELTVDVLDGIYDSVKNLARLASIKTKLLRQNEEEEFDEYADALEKSIGDNNPKGPRPVDFEPDHPGGALGRVGSGLLAIHTKASSYERQIDGWKANGLMWQLFGRGRNEAADAEATERGIAHDALEKLYSVYGASDLIDMDKKRVIPGTRISLSKRGAISVALNYSSQREKLIGGDDKWTGEDVNAILETLDKRDWDFCQSVWNFLRDTYKERVFALHKRVSDLELREVDYEPVVTKFGTYEGGYYPIKYSAARDAKEAELDAKTLAEERYQAAASGGYIRHNHRKERLKFKGRPTRLDLGVLTRHVSEVIHDLTHYEYVLDARRLLRDNRVKTAILENYGPFVLRELGKTLDDVATGDKPPADEWEKLLAWGRAGATISRMAWKFSTGLLQLTGLAQSAKRIGVKYVAVGMGKFFRGAAGMDAASKELVNSIEFLKNRDRTLSRDINEISNTMRGRGKVALYADAVTEFLKLGKVSDLSKSFFWFITRMQSVVDKITWLGAYEKHKDEAGELKAGESAEAQDARLRQLANQDVRDTQGGGQIGDLSSVQRGGPVRKSWTLFFSYMNVTFQLFREAKGQAKSVKDVPRFIADFALLYTIPAAMAFALHEMTRGGDDDDRKKRFVYDQLSYMAGTFVGLREISSSLMGFDYDGPAGVGLMKDLSDVVVQSRQAVDEGETDEAFWDATIKAGGTLFHLPADQIQRTADGFVEFVNGRQGPGAMFFGKKRE